MSPEVGVVNLSSRLLTPSELSVLKLGLIVLSIDKGFKFYDFCHDMFKFVRRVKLTEHFKDRSQAAPDSIEDDRDDTG